MCWTTKLEDRYERGEKLFASCKRNNFVIANDWYKNPPSNNTDKSSDG